MFLITEISTEAKFALGYAQSRTLRASQWAEGSELGKHQKFSTNLRNYCTSSVIMNFLLSTIHAANVHVNDPALQDK